VKDQSVESPFSDPVTITIVNNPPNVPTVIGPSQGIVNEDVNITVNANDPDGHPIRYKVDWNGDGSVDSTTLYMESGVPHSIIHAYTTAGDYTIRVKAQDEWGLETDWSSGLAIHISSPANISIGTITSEKNQIHAEIKNVGEASATNVQWQIQINGGLKLFVNISNGTISELNGGSTQVVTLTGNKYGIGIGLGLLSPNPIITISATCDEGLSAAKNATAMIFFKRVWNVQ